MSGGMGSGDGAGGAGRLGPAASGSGLALGDAPGLFSALYGDAEMAAILSDRASIAAMLRVEGELARAQAALGIIPADEADRIADAAARLNLDPAALAPGVAAAGIAAQPVIAALKRAAGGFAHYGATSQDIVDTAFALQLTEALALLEARRAALAETLAQKAQRYAAQPIPARTRHQIAAPTTLGAKIAVWQGMLDRAGVRLAQMRPRLLWLSLHGAAGTSAALGPQADALRARMAEALHLTVPPGPWHAARDGMAELAGWLSLLTGGLGKLGLDLIQLGQSEIAEVTAGAGGGSSTMPQKSNPVAAEALVTLARLNAGDVAGVHQALIHAQERDGSALGIEWAILPQMLTRSAAALRLAQGLAETLAPDPARIAASFAADRGRMGAEAAGFLLSRQMPREAALALVARALAAVATDDHLTLPQALEALAPGPDWHAELDPARLTGPRG